MSQMDDALRALKAADAAGNAEDARQLAQIVRQLQQQKPSFGAGDILPSLGRGVSSTLGLIGDVQGAILSGVGVPDNVSKYLRPTNTEELRALADKGVDLAGGEEGESIFSGGEGTLRGRALEFSGSSLTFGSGGLIKTFMQEGSKAFAKATAKNVVGSSLAGSGSFAGEKVAGTPGALVGAFVPASIGATAKGTVKTVLRGFGKEKQIEMARNLKADLEQGAKSTLGSTSGVQRGATIERSFESLPGSHGPFLRGAVANAKNLQKRLGGLLGNRGYKEETAGGHVASALKKRLDVFRKESRRLYDDAEKLITNRNTIIPIRGTRDKLTKLSAQDGGHEFRAIFDSVKAQDDIASKLLSQMTGENTRLVGMSFEQANRLRKVIGQQISLAKSVGDPTQGALKSIYASISRDVQAGAFLAGGKPAQHAFSKATAYWRKNRRIVDRLIDPMIRRDVQPEVLFREVVGTALNKPTKLKLLLQGMNKEQKEYFAKTFISKLGNIDDSSGAVIDALWSPGRLVSNWAKIPASQKDVLFSSTPKLKFLRIQLDKYMKVLERQKQGAGILANPSGTAGTGLAAATLQSALANTGKIVTLGLGGTVALGGPIGGMAAIGMAMGGANVGARLMNSPRFLKWLTTASAAPMKELPKHISRLNNLANDDPEFVQALDAFNTALILQGEQQ